MKIIETALLLALLNFVTSQLTARHKNKDDFEDVYEITDTDNSNRTYLFKIECRSYQLLSLRVITTEGNKEMPRYKVFFSEERMGMNRQQFTALKYCHAEMKIEESPFKISIFRKGT